VAKSKNKKEKPAPKPKKKSVAKKSVVKKIQGLTAPTEADFLRGREEGAEHEDSRYIVAFHLNDVLYAVDVGYVAAVISSREVAKLPHTPSFIEGLVSVRGEMVLVMNLKRRLSMDIAASLEGNILITESLDHEIGILVDKMAGVMEVPLKLKKLPKSGKEADSERYFQGMVKVGESDVKVLDMEKLMDFELPAGAL
jgi:purine-binding chemotaxis protein CheW